MEKVTVCCDRCRRELATFDRLDPTVEISRRFDARLSPEGGDTFTVRVVRDLKDDYVEADFRLCAACVPANLRDWATSVLDGLVRARAERLAEQLAEEVVAVPTPPRL